MSGQIINEINAKEKKVRNILAIIVGSAMSLFHIYFLGFATMSSWPYRLIHVTFAIVLILILYPLREKGVPWRLSNLIDLALILIAVYCCFYICNDYEHLVFSMQIRPTALDVFVCVAGCLLVLEAMRRSNGSVMIILAAIFVLYAIFGKYMPAAIAHKGYSVSRLSVYTYSLNGIFGTSIGTSSTYVVPFVIFGAILEGTGGSRLFIDTAIAGFGRFRGGPAKAAILASAGMGTINGTSAGNVVTTGTFTIPLMKKIGYKPEFAGAVEAVASSGGQIMPPVMGAGAFLLAEAIGEKYLRVAGAAVIPALLYFLSVFVMVDCEALKLKMRGLPKEGLPKVKLVMQEVGHLIIPIIILLYILVIENSTPIKAGLYATYATLIIALVRKTTRYNFKQLFQMLYNGAKSCVSVIMCCATAGILVASLSLTGLGAKLAGLIIKLSGGSLFITLVLTMVVTIILGMGMPTTASYIIAATVVAPALTNMGLTPLCAHMFVFYFACMAAITPPVAIASYAAAGLAGTNPNTTGWVAFRLGLCAFIVPYMFVYSNALLGIGTPWVILRSAVTASVGVVFFGMSMAGWCRHRANMIVRIILFAAAILLIDQGVVTDIIGVVLAVSAFLLQTFVFKVEQDKIIEEKEAQKEAKRAEREAKRAEKRKGRGEGLLAALRRSTSEE